MTVTTTTPKQIQKHPVRSQRFIILHRLVQRPQNLFGLTIIILLFSFALFSPWVAPYNPLEPNFDNRLQSPSLGHLLGTDELGRDVFSRIVYGSRVSLSAALVPIIGSMIFGVILGLVAGYIGGRVDMTIMAVMDGILAIPGLLLMLGITSVLGPSIRNALIAIAFTGIPGFARVVRGQVLSIAPREFVTAANTIGCSRKRILFKHILPNTLAPIIVTAAIRVGGAILAEASLSFLGLGVQPPTPSWGVMVALGNAHLRTAPWLAIAPGAAIFLITLAANFLGNGIHEAIMPQRRRK